MDRRYTLEDFLPRVGEAFDLRYPDHSDTLTLVEAFPAKIQVPGFPLGFFLRFVGGNTQVMLSQHSYLLHNDRLGALRILLTPMQRRADDVFIYEAVFS